MSANMESPGLLPLSLRRARIGRQYRERPPTNEDRLRAYRDVTPLPEVAHPWLMGRIGEQYRDSAEYAASQEPQEPIQYADRRGV